MRYGLDRATAAFPMPPLARSVVAPTQRTGSVAFLRPPLALATPSRGAVTCAVTITSIATPTDDDPNPATSAVEDPMAVHGDDSPSRTGQPRRSAATLRAADSTATAVGVC